MSEPTTSEEGPGQPAVEPHVRPSAISMRSGVNVATGKADKPDRTFFKPMLCHDGKKRLGVVPTGPDWAMERKFDGMRLLAHVREDGSVRLYGGRNGADHTGNAPRVETDRGVPAARHDRGRRTDCRRPAGWGRDESIGRRR